MKNLENLKLLELNQEEMTSIDAEGWLSCGLAIGGTLVATAGFAFVTGGAGLVVALAGKGIAVASVIDSCH